MAGQVESSLDSVSLRQLRYFLQVVDTDSVSAAATLLYVAQPSLSQVVRRLEALIGGDLFVRTPRGLTLTDFGQDFAKAARQALTGLHEVLPERHAHPLRVATPRGTPPRAIDIARNLLGADRELVFVQNDSARQLAMLRAGALDGCIVRELSDANDCRIDQLTREPLGIVYADSHPFATQGRISWQDLSDQELLWFDERRAPEFAERVLEAIRTNGWDPELRRFDTASDVLFRDALSHRRSLVAIRPQAAVESCGNLLWRPLPDPVVLYEELYLVRL
jgi:DNA-binding transcriptional LysR family regulator